MIFMGNSDIALIVCLRGEIWKSVNYIGELRKSELGKIQT